LAGTPSRRTNGGGGCDSEDSGTEITAAVGAIQLKQRDSREIPALSARFFAMH